MGMRATEANEKDYGWENVKNRTVTIYRLREIISKAILDKFNLNTQINGDSLKVFYSSLTPIIEDDIDYHTDVFGLNGKKVNERLRDKVLEDIFSELSSDKNLHNIIDDVKISIKNIDDLIEKYTALKVFEESAPEIDKPVGHGKLTLLHVAVMEGDLEAVRRLVEDGASINVKDNANLTPLDRARMLGFEEIGNFLSQYIKI